MATPDITPVQKLGAAGLLLEAAVFGLLRAFGIDITDVQVAAIGGFTTAFVSFAVAADAVIRHGRATGLGKKSATDSSPGPESSASPTMGAR